MPNYRNSPSVNCKSETKFNLKHNHYYERRATSNQQPADPSRRTFLKTSFSKTLLVTNAAVFAGLINTPGAARADTTDPGTTDPGTTDPGTTDPTSEETTVYETTVAYQNLPDYQNRSMICTSAAVFSTMEGARADAVRTEAYLASHYQHMVDHTGTTETFYDEFDLVYGQIISEDMAYGNFLNPVYINALEENPNTTQSPITSVISVQSQLSPSYYLRWYFVITLNWTWNYYDEQSTQNMA